MNEEKYLKKLEVFLLSVDRNNAELTSEWANSFPTLAGVYLARQEDRIVYIGETGSLSGRMHDMLDTRHHNLRRQIGHKLFGVKASTTEKFSPDNEKTLESYIHEKISISYIVVKLGRKELEEHFIAKYNPIYNQKGKRS